MLKDKIVEKDITYYILQPFNEQAIAISKFIKKHAFNKLVAVVLRENKYKSHPIYDEILVVDSYLDLPQDSTIVPTGAQSTEYLLKKNDVCLGNVRMIQSNLAVYNKINFFKHCRINNLPIPNQFNYEDLNETSFPIFYKQKNEKGGGVRGIANSLQEINQLPIQELVFQELIESKGTYGVAFLAKNGEIITSISHHEIESYPLSGGSATVIKKLENTRLAELTSKFVQSCGYEGWGLAEYKYCPKRKDFVFMEVNAKFWASCYFSFQNNPIFLKELFHINIKENSKIETLIFINRLLNTGVLNTVKTLRSYKGAVKLYESSILKSLIRALLTDLGLWKYIL